MIRIYCEAADAVLKETQTLTAGMQNYPDVILTFSDDWDGYGKAVVVKAGTVEKSVLVVNNKFTVPHECLANSGVNLIVGVSGSDGVHTIPTIWCSCGEIMDSVDIDEDGDPGDPTSSLVEQMLAYAEDIQGYAEALDENVIRTVRAVTTGVDQYGTANVSLTDSGAGEDRTLTFTFANLKGNGIEALAFVSDGPNKGRITVTLSDGTIIIYDGLRDAISYIDNYVIDDVEEFLANWIEQHPEYVTTVEDGAISYQKLNEYLQYAVTNTILTPSESFAIPASGSSVTKYIDGLSSNHVLVSWNFSESAESDPPAELTCTCYDGFFTVSNASGTTSETIKPIFMLPTAKEITNQ